MVIRRSCWRRVLAGFVVLAALSSCGDDADTAPTTGGPDPTDLDLPADAEPVTSPEGDQVYYSESAGTVYGECVTIDPHADDVAGWLGLDPPRGSADVRVVCI